MPDYIHGNNIPNQHFERPFKLTGDDLEDLPAHLAETRVAMGTRAAGTMQSGNGTGMGVGTSKPSALKPYGATARPPALQVSG